MKKLLKGIFSALVLIALLASSALAAVPDPHEDFYYLDQVGVMSSETKSLLYTNGEALKKACGAQIVVCIVDSFGKMSDEDFAYELINKWGVGDKDKKNGVALVIAETDGVYRMVIGTGLERYMDGSDVQDLLDRYFHPYFKDYQTDKGIQALYAPLFKKICQIYDVNVSLVTGSALPDEEIIYDDVVVPGYYEEDSGLSFMSILVIVIILIIIISIVNRNNRHRAHPGGSVHRPTRRPVIIINRPHFGGHRPGGHRPMGGFGGFGSSSSGRSRSGGFSGSRSSGRSGGFGGARGGGGGSRGVGGGGRR